MANPLRRPDGRVTLRTRLLVLVVVAAVVLVPATVVVAPLLRSVAEWVF